MRKNSKRITSLIMLVVMVAVFAVGCSEGSNSTNTSTSLNNKDEVVAVINGVEIKREEISEELSAAEKAIVENYVNTYLLKEFYKDIEVSDIEVEAQFAIIKGQIGEIQWQSYLDYIGVKDEDEFKELIRDDLRVTKKRESLKTDIEVSEEEIKGHYEEFKNSFDLMVGNMVFFDTLEEFAEGRRLHEEGRSLDDIASTMGKDVYENEHVSFDYNGFEVSLRELEVGDVVFTKESNNALAIMEVIKIDDTYEVLKETVADDLKNQKAQELINEELEEFYNKAKVTILGEEIQ